MTITKETIKTIKMLTVVAFLCLLAYILHQAVLKAKIPTEITYTQGVLTLKFNHCK